MLLGVGPCFGLLQTVSHTIPYASRKHQGLFLQMCKVYLCNDVTRHRGAHHEAVVVKFGVIASEAKQSRFKTRLLRRLRSSQ